MRLHAVRRNQQP